MDALSLKSVHSGKVNSLFSENSYMCIFSLAQHLVSSALQLY